MVLLIKEKEASELRTRSVESFVLWYTSLQTTASSCQPKRRERNRECQMTCSRKKCSRNVLVSPPDLEVLHNSSTRVTANSINPHRDHITAPAYPGPPGYCQLGWNCRDNGA